VQRAESLEARGLGGRTTRPEQWRSLVGVVGVGLLSWGAFAAYYGGGVVPVVPLVCGAGLIVIATVRRGARSASYLTPDTYSSSDLIVLAASVLSVVFVLVLRALDAGDVSYLAYPEVRIPAFSLPGALSSALLAVPVLFVGRGEE
jgi:hypothetical protein